MSKQPPDGIERHNRSLRIAAILRLKYALNTHNILIKLSNSRSVGWGDPEGRGPVLSRRHGPCRGGAMAERLLGDDTAEVKRRQWLERVAKELTVAETWEPDRNPDEVVAHLDRMDEICQQGDVLS